MPLHLSPLYRDGGKVPAHCGATGSFVEQVALHGRGQRQSGYLAKPGVPQRTAHTQAAQVQKGLRFLR